jgi:hypothetical protein
MRTPTFTTRVLNGAYWSEMGIEQPSRLATVLRVDVGALALATGAEALAIGG